MSNNGGNPSMLLLENPLDIDDARRASRRMSEQRRAAEQDHERHTREAADAERKYRVALAQAYIRIRTTGTAAERTAVARAEVADLSYARDLAAGMVKVGAERLKGLEGERSMLKSLVDWSAKMAERPAP